jgi:uncharacterized protein YbaA (DUF1428 family)
MGMEISPPSLHQEYRRRMLQNPITDGFPDCTVCAFSWCPTAKQNDDVISATSAYTSRHDRHNASAKILARNLLLECRLYQLMKSRLARRPNIRNVKVCIYRAFSAVRRSCRCLLPFLRQSVCTASQVYRRKMSHECMPNVVTARIPTILMFYFDFRSYIPGFQIDQKMMRVYQVFVMAP